jgi:nucleotide-binding universal stress UspA family protein
MEIVLCATRGGEESISAQLKAIEIARERGARIAFLYVADSSFLDRIAAGVVVDIQEELSKMGEFFLTMARERARVRGVEADAVIRQGKFRNELEGAAQDLQASVIVLGNPSERSSRIALDEFEAFKAQVSENTGLEVISP